MEIYLLLTIFDEIKIERLHDLLKVSVIKKDLVNDFNYQKQVTFELTQTKLGAQFMLTKSIFLFKFSVHISVKESNFFFRETFLKIQASYDSKLNQVDCKIVYWVTRLSGHKCSFQT